MALLSIPYHPSDKNNNNSNLPLGVRWLSRLLEPGWLFLESESLSLNHVRLFATSWTVVCQAPLSMEFFRQEYWSGWPFSSPDDCPERGIKPGPRHCRQILYHVSHQGSPSRLKRVSSSVVFDSETPWTVTCGLLCPWDSPGKNTGMDCHSLLQRIFPTQGSNPGPLHCRQILYHLSYRVKGSYRLNS